MKYAFIKAHQDCFAVEVCCQLFGVNRSGYYAWLDRPLSKRALANQALDAKIHYLFNQHRERAGSPRMTQDLRAANEYCSETRVARRMQVLGLRALAKCKFKVTTDSSHTHSVYENVLDRQFDTTGVNQKWAGDITYISTAEGWLYLAVVLDLHSRAVIGWSMSKRIKAALVCDALLMALRNKGFPQGVIIHCDRGTQYCSKQYHIMIEQYQLIGSMSRKGTCWDNAISESFFHTLKVELIHQHYYKSRAAAQQSVFQYIEGYYNRKRRHSSIGYRYPIQVEMAA